MTILTITWRCRKWNCRNVTCMYLKLTNGAISATLRSYGMWRRTLLPTFVSNLLLPSSGHKKCHFIYCENEVTSTSASKFLPNTYQTTRSHISKITRAVREKFSVPRGRISLQDLNSHNTTVRFNRTVSATIRLTDNTVVMFSWYIQERRLKSVPRATVFRTSVL
jgi:hypothetical protein